jgi:hypothetical protein
MGTQQNPFIIPYDLNFFQKKILELRIEFYKNLFFEYEIFLDKEDENFDALPKDNKKN